MFGVGDYILRRDSVWTASYDVQEQAERRVIQNTLSEIRRSVVWGIRRRSPNRLLHGFRKSAKRGQRFDELRNRTAPYRKSAAARPTDGPAVIVGDFSGNYGLARGAAYDLQHAQSRHSETLVIDIGPYRSKRQAADNVITQPVENVYFLCQPNAYDTAFSLFDPRALSNAYRVSRWLWETPLFPEDWRFSERLIHEIWTPSEYCAEVFRKGLDLPVACRPHKIAPPEFANQDIRSKLNVRPDAFMGLAIMDITSCPQRKNPWAHIAAWKEAFGSADDAVLVMKVRVSRRTAFVLTELRELADGANNIKLITEDLSNSEISSLQHSCDVYLSLHRAEGYGLTIHEALLCDKPVLATHWSANTEFGPRFRNYTGISYELVRYDDWTRHYAETDFLWADADIAHAAAELGRVRSEHNEARYKEPIRQRASDR